MLASLVTGSPRSRVASQRSSWLTCCGCLMHSTSTSILRMTAAAGPVPLQDRSTSTLSSTSTGTDDGRARRRPRRDGHGHRYPGTGKAAVRLQRRLLGVRCHPLVAVYANPCSVPSAPGRHAVAVGPAPRQRGSAGPLGPALPRLGAFSAFSLLATPVGEDCAGAVRFSLPDEVDRALGRRGDVVWLTEAQVGQRLRELKEDSTAWLGRSFSGQFSLAGAQAKTALLRQDGAVGRPFGVDADDAHLEAGGLGVRRSRPQ